MGNNGDGRLGLGDLELKESNVPCLVEGIADHFVTKVQCGLAHTIALTNNGEAWAWGQGYYGSLGVDTLKSQYSPVPV